MIKSGTDFREYSKIKLNFQNKNKVDVQIEKCIVDSSIQEDKELKEVVDKYVGKSLLSTTFVSVFKSQLQ